MEKKSGKPHNLFGVTLIFCIVGIVICFLVVHGYNLKFTYSDENKKIEVQAMNSNSLGK